MSLFHFFRIKIRSGLLLKNFFFYRNLDFFFKQFNYTSLKLKLFNFFNLFDTLFIFTKKSFIFDSSSYTFKNSLNLLLKYKNIKKISFLSFFNHIISFHKNNIFEFKQSIIKETFKYQIKKYKHIKYK